ncbi:MAG: hypothetical protein HXX17_01405 [Geobacteraceae bacterium]|nr:hypothetical protein [Geobacteraceae bacterium]
MFRNLKLYYIIVSLPFLLLLVGSAAFFDAIRNTITRNPHPQINYVIFCIILIGGVLILLSVRKLMDEAKATVEFSEALHAFTDIATLQKMANSYSGDVSYVLQMVAASSGRFISHQEQVSIDHEMSSVRNALYRRNALPQYLTGLLVGMGLLGTFVGLLATLGDISILINSFAEIDMGTASPLIVFRTMIERMKAPMQSMGIAFSASMFGLLGSIILGLMMVGLRRFQGDILSLLGSEVARHIENALAYESDNSQVSIGVKAVNRAVSVEEDSKILLRIEERLAETSRQQQRTLSLEVDEFQKQRADMLRVMTEQTEASNGFRSELQQLGRQLAAVVTVMEKSNSEIYSQISELTVHLSANSKESHRLLKTQIDEQKNLKETVDSFKIEERLAELSRTQQRTLSSEVGEFQKQRGEMINVIGTQTEASNNFRSELQQLGRHLGTINSAMEKDNGQIFDRISDLAVNLSADAKESHKLLTMQVNEQVRLRELLALLTANKG